MLTHCDFIYTGESAKFRMSFIDLAVLPEFGSSWSLPAGIGHVRAAELVLLGLPFDARRDAELGLVTRVVPHQSLMATATKVAWKLAAKPSGALRACKRIMKAAFIDQIKAAMELENKEFSVQVRSNDANEEFSAFPEKRAPHFNGPTKSVPAA